MTKYMLPSRKRRYIRGVWSSGPCDIHLTALRAKSNATGIFNFKLSSRSLLKKCKITNGQSKARVGILQRHNYPVRVA